jgi:hypothetical protein
MFITIIILSVALVALWTLAAACFAWFMLLLNFMMPEQERKDLAFKHLGEEARFRPLFLTCLLAWPLMACFLYQGYREFCLSTSFERSLEKWKKHYEAKDKGLNIPASGVAECIERGMCVESAPKED